MILNTPSNLEDKLLTAAVVDNWVKVNGGVQTNIEKLNEQNESQAQHYGRAGPAFII